MLGSGGRLLQGVDGLYSSPVSLGFISPFPESCAIMAPNCEPPPPSRHRGTAGPQRCSPARHAVCPLSCPQHSVQRSAFDRHASASQSGGTFSVASGPNLTLLVRRLLFFYKQSEDSKRLVSVNYVLLCLYLCIFQHFFNGVR